jgi:hypothetical protein
VSLWSSGYNSGCIDEVDPATGAITNVADFDGLAMGNDGYLMSMDGINYSGSTKQIVFNRLTFSPPIDRSPPSQYADDYPLLRVCVLGYWDRQP